MTARKKQSESVPATKTRQAKGAPARPVVVSAPAVASGPPKDDATCEGALGRVIRLAQATLPRDGKGEAPVDPVSTVSNQARESLEKALDGLDSETALKLRTLMIAGRDGKSISDVNVNLTIDDSRAAFATAALDASQNGPLLADYLRRGHALACATALDLERPLAGWSSATSHSLDERAWLSFGKQLAKSNLDDWQCLAFVESENQAISRLYLRLEEHAWWSFQAVLDRPTAATVEKYKRTLTSRRSKGLATRSLTSLVAKLSAAEGRALRRAARAIRARVGEAALAT